MFGDVENRQCLLNFGIIKIRNKADYLCENLGVLFFFWKNNSPTISPSVSWNMLRIFHDFLKTNLYIIVRVTYPHQPYNQFRYLIRFDNTYIQTRTHTVYFYFYHYYAGYLSTHVKISILTTCDVPHLDDRTYWSPYP